ncbi:MAG: hypothetical protein M1822_007441 [Bathelium mastoideum]|nr:MAG: hypothetical protein M1822_007441 [Bathelium mastoideum]
MDILGTTASAIQLTGYGKSVFHQLVRLCKAVRHGPAAYRDQLFNITILLNIVKRIPEQGELQQDPIPQLLVDIAKLAHDIQTLLKKKGPFGLNWALITGWEALSQTFTSLNEKRDLLHLHISERNQNVLTQIRSDIIQMSQDNFKGKGQRLGSITDTEPVQIEPVREDKMPEEDKKPESSSSKAPILSGKESELKSERKDYKNAETSAGSVTSGGAMLTGNKTTMSGWSRQNVANGYPQAPTLKDNTSDIQEGSENTVANAPGWTSQSTTV